MNEQVLIVEDDPDIREALGEIFLSEDLAVRFAETGAAGIQALREMPQPMVVLLDLMMPGTDGQWFRAEQMKDASISAVPVILMSAHNQGTDLVNRLGLAGCLKKPIHIEDLLATVRRFLH